MKVDFSTMTKDEAIAYCYKHANKFKSEMYASGVNGEREFDCLIGIIEDDTISPSELPQYGMIYED